MFSIVIPVRNGARTLPVCLAAINASTVANREVIVVDDGSTDDTAAIARRQGATATSIAPSGPAAARNAGARIARGEILVFVDADVEVRPGTLAQFARSFADDPTIDAAFGSYDDEPAARGLVSTFKNLQHHYVHQHGSRESASFWTGCGAIRRNVFAALGGFDESIYPHPSTEDIELGSRLHAAGRRTVLMPEILVKHHRSWPLGNLVATDLFRRAVPWTRIMLLRDEVTSDLNLNGAARLSVVALVVALCAAFAIPARPPMAWVALGAFGIFSAANIRFYGLLLRRRGPAFVLASIPLHAIYYGVAITGFALGTIIAARDRLRQREDPLVNRLGSAPVLIILAVSIALTFPVMQAIRGAPYVDDVLEYGQPRDDWTSYRRNAVSIVHDGLAMPVVDGIYVRPAGFLYNYFVAGVFALFGENAAWVYIVQSAGLGVSLAFFILGFRKRLGARASLALAIALGLVGWIDCFRYYSNRLLSENLPIMVVPILLLSAIRAGETTNWRFELLTGVLAGIAFLARPNIILAGPLFALMILVARRGRGGLRAAALILIGWLAMFALLPLRNAIVTGSPNISAVTTTGDWNTPRGLKRLTFTEKVVGWTRQVARQTAVVAGFNQLAHPSFRPRPHWTLIMVGVVLLVVIRFARGSPEWWELVLLGYTAAYLGPLIAISRIGSYGIRMIIPILGVLAVLGVRGFSIAVPRRKTTRSDTA